MLVFALVDWFLRVDRCLLFVCCLLSFVVVVCYCLFSVVVVCRSLFDVWCLWCGLCCLILVVWLSLFVVVL